MTKKMQIKLLPNGEIRMETHGVKGKKCNSYVELFKKLVNVNIAEIHHTKEYYETEEYIQSEDSAEIKRDF